MILVYPNNIHYDVIKSTCLYPGLYTYQSNDASLSTHISVMIPVVVVLIKIHQPLSFSQIQYLHRMSAGSQVTGNLLYLILSTTEGDWFQFVHLAWSVQRMWFLIIYHGWSIRSPQLKCMDACGPGWWDKDLDLSRREASYNIWSEYWYHDSLYNDNGGITLGLIWYYWYYFLYTITSITILLLLLVLLLLLQFLLLVSAIASVVMMMMWDRKR